jgi:hypothetical protein
VTVQSLAWALDQSVPGTAKLVLLALANRAEDDTGYVHFDAAAAARLAVIPERSLWRYLGALERNGYLDKEASTDERKYWLALDRVSSAPWSWTADDLPDEADTESAAPASVVASAPRRLDSAPQNFSRDRQIETRKSAAPTAEPRTEFPIVEGSKAHKAWCERLRAEDKLVPFTRWITLADGKPARGFYMPSLFPPRRDGIENLEGAA